MTVTGRALIALACVAAGRLLLAQATPQPDLPAGDAARGKSIVESARGNCLSCHSIRGTGSLYGPDLTAIGVPARGGGGGARGGGGGGARAGGGGDARGRGEGGGGAAGNTPARGGAPAQPAGGQPGPLVLATETARAALRQQLAESILDPNAVVSVQNRYVRLTMKDGRVVWGKLLNLDTFAVQIFDSTEKLANVSRQDVRDLTMTSPMPSYKDKLTTAELADVVAYLMTLEGK
jgi:putative heme-binding domain-containing protein